MRAGCDEVICGAGVEKNWLGGGYGEGGAVEAGSVGVDGAVRASGLASVEWAEEAWAAAASSWT